MENYKKNIVPELQKKAENPDREKDRGIVNENNKSSMMIGEKGDFVVASNRNIQYKLSSSGGQATEISYSSNTVTNRRNIKTDDLIFNRHKLNPQLWELTDMKKYLNDPTSGIGNLTMYATVLVKAWEPYLKKWVLIRRPMRTPIFSNLLNDTSAPKEMSLNDDISNEIKLIRKL